MPFPELLTTIHALHASKHHTTTTDNSTLTHNLEICIKMNNNFIPVLVYILNFSTVLHTIKA